MLPQIIEILKKGGIGVLPTDTIYGLVGSALSKKTVLRIYKVRKRELNKPFIVLIGSLNDLNKFGIHITPRIRSFLEMIWPLRQAQGKPVPVSVILPCLSKKFFYLHRGIKSLAFRLPRDRQLRKILKQAGPLVAPSANIAGEPPAKNIAEARKYFGEQVDFYFGQKAKKGSPSTLIEIKR